MSMGIAEQAEFERLKALVADLAAKLIALEKRQSCLELVRGDKGNKRGK